jgi:hypothetical protein
MGVWRSIFGWRALFSWGVLGVVVPGVFVAVGLGVLGIEWFPYHLLISQVCFGIATFLCIVKFVGHAVESNGTFESRIVFAVLLCSLTLASGVWIIDAIQKHKTDAVQIEKHPPLLPPAGPTIIQNAVGSDCSNIVAKDAKIKCEVEKAREKEHGEDKPSSNP